MEIRSPRANYALDQRTAEAWTTAEGPQCQDYGKGTTLPVRNFNRTVLTLGEMRKKKAMSE